MKIKVNLRYASQEYHKKNENGNAFPPYEPKPVLHVPATLLSSSMVVGCSVHPVEVQTEDVVGLFIYSSSPIVAQIVITLYRDRESRETKTASYLDRAHLIV